MRMAGWDGRSRRRCSLADQQGTRNGQRLSAAAAGAVLVGSVFAQGVITLRVVGDAVPSPLTSTSGDPARGRAITLGRDANCVLCHAVPGPDVRFAGNLGPPLAGVGARLSAGQLRLRIVDSSRLNPETIMPAYHRVDGLRQVAKEFAGKPVLDAQSVEDVVAYLLTLRE